MDKKICECCGSPMHRDMDDEDGLTYVCNDCERTEYDPCPDRRMDAEDLAELNDDTEDS